MKKLFGNPFNPVVLGDMTKRKVPTDLLCTVEEGGGGGPF